MKWALVHAESIQVDPLTELSNAKGFGVDVGSCIDNLHRLSVRQRGFTIPSVDLRRSPFERLVLPIIFEVVPDVSARQKANYVLVHAQDSRNSQTGAYAAINSYNIEEVRFNSSHHSYGTDLGALPG